ncbi:Protein of unknown function [Gryllus bimaculatus]|nr:Protein of unknown function [Gryllus bimaculatus]
MHSARGADGARAGPHHDRHCRDTRPVRHAHRSPPQLAEPVLEHYEFVPYAPTPQPRARSASGRRRRRCAVRAVGAEKPPARHAHAPRPVRVAEVVARGLDAAAPPAPGGAGRPAAGAGQGHALSMEEGAEAGAGPTADASKLARSATWAAGAERRGECRTNGCASAAVTLGAAAACWRVHSPGQL